MAFDGTLKFDTAIDQSGFKSGLAGLGSVAKAGMAAVTTAVTAAAGAVSALGGYAVSVGKDFEGSMAQVIATMGITKDTIQDGVNSYDLLKEAAAAAGESTTFSASEAADALNYLALAGYDAVKAAEALPAVLDLAAAGGLDLAYASDLATDAMAALGIEATSDNLTRFGDEMAKTASKANTSVSQLGEAILTVGGTAQTLAGGTEELNAALGVLANRGIKGAEGGTHLRNMILSLSAPTDTAKKALDSLGVSALDADGNMRPLNETFADLDKALSGMSDGDKAAVLSDIFNKTDLAAAQGLLAGCGQEFGDLTAALADCDGAMADMAHTMNDTLEGDIKSLQSKAEAFGIAIYEDLNEPLRELAQLGGDYISQLTAAFKDGGFEGLAESFGDVLGQAVTKISEYLPTIAEMGASIVTSLIDGLISNIDGISSAASDILLTIVRCAVDIIPKVIVAGITIITSLAQGLADNVDVLVDSVVDGIVLLASALLDNIEPLIGAALKIILALAESLLGNMPMLLDALLTVVKELAQAILDNLPLYIEMFVQIRSALLSFLIESIPALLEAATELFMAIVEALPFIIDALVEQLPEIILSTVNALISAAPEIAAAALTLFMEIVKAIPQIIAAVGSGLAELGSKAAGWLGDILSDGWTALTDWLSETLERVKQGAADIVSGAMEFLDELPHRLGEMLGNALGNIVQWAIEAPSKAKEAASKFLDNVRTFFRELPGNVKDWLDKTIAKVADWAKDLMQKGKNAAKDLVDAVVNGITSLPQKMADAGKNLVEGLWNGITNAGNWLKDKISDFGSGIIDGFKSAFGIASPSKVMRDRVGRYLAQGIGVGFTDEMPDVGREAVKAMQELTVDIGDIEPEGRRPRFPGFSGSALSALSSQTAALNVPFAQPSATSEVVSNSYTYNNTTNNGGAPGTAESIILNAQFVVGEEVVAEGVLDLVADEVDSAQGVKIQMKKRGLTT